MTASNRNLNKPWLTGFTVMTLLSVQPAFADVGAGFYCKALRGERPIAMQSAIACGQNRAQGQPPTYVCRQNVECTYVGAQMAQRFHEAEARQRQEIIRSRGASTMNTMLPGDTYDPNPQITDLAAIANNLRLRDEYMNDLVWLRSEVTCPASPPRTARSASGAPTAQGTIECPRVSDCYASNLVQSVAAVTTTGGIQEGESGRLADPVVPQTTAAPANMH